MPTLFLHAGAGKTGTSYLQVLFAKYAERLKEAGVIYPRGHLFDEAAAGQITSGNGVAMANYICPDMPHAIPDKSVFIHELDGQLRSVSGEHVLYSSEYFRFPPARKEQIASILEVTKAHGYQVRVIYLVRDVAAAAFSVYSQRVKNHDETRPFSDYIKVCELGYQRKLQNAVDCFGANSVIVYNFEEHRARLAALFFQDILGAGFVPDDQLIVNRSLSPNEAEMLRLMNTMYPSDVTAFITKVWMGIEVPPIPFEIITEQAALLEHRFSDEVEYVNGLVRGEQIVIARHVVDQEAAPNMSDSERATIAILAKLVSTTLETHSELIRREAGISDLRADLAHRAAELHAIKRELHAMRNSKSWRVTAPLRWLRSRCV
jgi:hypothetical protein